MSETASTIGVIVCGSCNARWQGDMSIALDAICPYCESKNVSLGSTVAPRKGGIQAWKDQEDARYAEEAKNAAGKRPRNAGAYSGYVARLEELREQGLDRYQIREIMQSENPDTWPDPKITSTKAYEERVRELVDEQKLSLEAAKEQALVEAKQSRTKRKSDGLSFAATRELMKREVAPGNGRSSKGRRRHDTKPLPPSERISRRLRDYDERETEEERAFRMMHENAQRMEEHRLGPPLKGKEIRMHVQARLEPSAVYEMHALTGLNCGALLEEMHDLLRMARDAKDKTAILDRLSILISSSDEQCA